MAEKLTINQWAEEDRPREKMMLHGVGTLSDAELLAILIGSGNTEDSAVELMRKVLSDYHNSLNELGKTTVDELCLCHNHPSGSMRPSTEDDRLTEHLDKAAKVMNIRLIDHVILTDGKFYSYADEGKI